MPRIDHVAVETGDPDAAAEFYEFVFGARIVKTEGHPVMAYVGNTGFAFHEPGGPGGHTAVRVSEEERAAIKERLEGEGIRFDERDHDIAVGLFFRDPDGRQLEAITYKGGDDPRRS
jgi:catechol 2,3-dioxygenase-like lactoylglutathione lyase family enzyme